MLHRLSLEQEFLQVQIDDVERKRIVEQVQNFPSPLPVPGLDRVWLIAIGGQRIGFHVGDVPSSEIMLQDGIDEVASEPDRAWYPLLRFCDALRSLVEEKHCLENLFLPRWSDDVFDIEHQHVDCTDSAKGVVVLLAALVAYPLSLGPVAWLASATGEPKWLHAMIDTVYAPVFASFRYIPRPVVLWYVGRASAH